MRHNKGPQRQCIGCRGIFPKEELLRFVQDSQRGPIFDERHCRGGRGYYVCPTRTCLTNAGKNKRGKIIFRTQANPSHIFISVDEALLASVERLLGRAKASNASKEVFDAGDTLCKGDVLLIRDDMDEQTSISLNSAAKAHGARIFYIPPRIIEGSDYRVIEKNSPKVSPLLRNLRFCERLSSKGRAL